MVRIISVPQLWNCFHTRPFSSVTLTPLHISILGCSSSGFGRPKSTSADFVTLTENAGESDAEAMCEPAGLIPETVGKATVGFAGLASAGEWRDVALVLVLATEMAVVGEGGVEERTAVAGPEMGTLAMGPSSTCWSCMDTG